MAKKDQYNFSGVEQDDTTDADTEAGSGAASGSDASTEPSAGHQSTAAGASQQPPSRDVDVESLPLKLRRNDVKNFRDGVTIQVQDETKHAIEQVQRVLSDAYRDETLYKLDLYEIIVLNGMFDDDGTIDEEGLKHQAELMGYGLEL